jgi:glycosyltransferase involved in cell wall biosynthesis
MRTAIAHDYLTQRGGAERVVLAMTRAFPEARVYTSLYGPEGTFPDFESTAIDTLWVDRLPLLRRHHRLGLPLFAGAFSRLTIDADVVLCSSSGWAHGVSVTGRKVVYCHAPARWLYQTDRYVRGRSAAAALSLVYGRMRRWDGEAARSADRYLANSTRTRDLVREVYGIDAEIVFPPFAVDASGTQRPVIGVDGGFVLCVSRLLPYKNVEAVLGAFRDLPSERLVVVGAGPDEARLRALAPPNVTLLGSVADEELRWLYGRCAALVSASYEDFGLTPLEAAAFGKPAAVLEFGGFLDTVRPETGVFFAEPRPEQIAAAIRRLTAEQWDTTAIAAHAGRFSEQRFAARLREIVAEEGNPANRLGSREAA